VLLSKRVVAKEYGNCHHAITVVRPSVHRPSVFPSVHYTCAFYQTEAPHNSPAGQLIRTSIEQAKLELGLAGRLFDHDFKTVGHLITECWIKNVWKETSAYGFRIIEQMGSLKPECEGDKMLMEAFMQNGYKGKEPRELNKCRLYL
jgi:hypothetical protein